MTLPSTKPHTHDTETTHANASVLDELSCILASPQFTGTSRSKRFLEYIVKETLAGRGDDIKGYTIAIDVFDKSSNFDSNQNTVVRVQASQLRRRLKLYYAENPHHSGVHISLPKGRYKPIFLTHTSLPNLRKDTSLTHPVNLECPILQIQPLQNHAEGQNYQSFTDAVTTELIHKLNALDIFQIRQGKAELTLIHSEGDDQDNDAPAQIDTQYSPENFDGSKDGYVLSGFLRRMDFHVRMTVLLSTKQNAKYVRTLAIEEKFTPENIFYAPETLAAQIVSILV